MTRLPVPGSDEGSWGGVLNDFLLAAHNNDGSLKDGSVTSINLAVDSGTDGQALVKDGSTSGGMKWSTISSGSLNPTGIPKSDLDTAVQASLDRADSALQSAPVSSVNGEVGAVSLTLTEVDNQTIPQALGIPTPGASIKAAAADHIHPAPTLNDFDDIDLTGIVDGDTLVYQNASGKFTAQPQSTATVIAPIWNEVTSGEITISRTAAMSDFLNPGTGTLHLTYFRAQGGETIGHIGFQTGSAGASGTLTLARVGLYAINDTTGALTLIGSSANRATGFTGAYASYDEALTASVALTSGATYAVGILQVGDTVANLMGVWQNNQFLGLRPRLGAVLSSQTDLPSSINDNQLVDHQLAVFAALRS